MPWCGGGTSSPLTCLDITILTIHTKHTNSSVCMCELSHNVCQKVINELTKRLAVVLCRCFTQKQHDVYNIYREVGVTRWPWCWGQDTLLQHMSQPALVGFLIEPSSWNIESGAPPVGTLKTVKRVWKLLTAMARAELLERLEFALFDWVMKLSHST